MIQPRLIHSKREYYRLAAAGLAGNCPRTWADPAAFLAESNDDLAGIRAMNRASGKFRAFVPRERLTAELKALELHPGEYVISETILPDEILLAGELTHTGGAWEFFYSYDRQPMRGALLEAGEHARGHHAVWGLLSAHCTPADVADLHELFDRYTVGTRYPVIELTVTKGDRGIIPHRNTLIWEVRHY